MARPSSFAAQPLYAPLATLLAELSPSGTVPSLDRLNALAAERGIVSGSGAPLRFVVPHGSALYYEERAWWLGEIETRPGNWHDTFNALVWLSFPLTKAALNRAHHYAIAASRSAPASAGRGALRDALRDALTQFDECGAIVVSSDLTLWDGLCAHRWKQVFWDARMRVESTLRVFVFGHATYDLLRNPHLGLCAKAVFLHIDDDWLAWPHADQLADVDVRIARRFTGVAGAVAGESAYARPRDFKPLPLLGIPGVTPDNQSAAYYDNTRQFRPLRLVSG